MNDDQIRIDNKFFDDLLTNINGTQMNLFDDYNITTSAATISQAASTNTWPYVTNSTGGYTLTTGTSTLGITNNDWFTPQKQTLHVQGDAEFEGDVKIKGRNLTDMLDKIEERLAILHPNEQLEDKWLELKKLGESYRKLEKDILEKEKIWETLKR